MDEPRNSPICNSIDRLSNLPETLIHHIFSFMDMKHVVQTCVLSKRWKLLWTCTPVLNFDSKISSLKNRRVVPSYILRFTKFVDQVFILHDGSDIQRVNLLCGKLRCSSDISTMTASLTTWLAAAVRRNIQELYLDISGAKVSRFPQCLFTCTSLRKLELKLGVNSGIMVLPASMGLPRLTFMKLDSLPSTDVNLTNRLFERCPVLESLIIEGRLGHMDIKISSLTLKHLKIVDRVSKTSSKVKINAPNLVSFVCRDHISKRYVLENLASLVTADIDMSATKDERCKVTDYTKNQWLLLSALSNAKELRLSGRFLLLSLWAKSRAKGFPAAFDKISLQFSNLRVVKLHSSYLSKLCIEALGWLFHFSPNVESLSIVIPGPLKPDDEIYWAGVKPDNENYWAGVSLTYKLDHLRSVEIRGLLGNYNELKLVETMFKNAVVLEKMVLFSSKTSTTDKRIITFGEKLLKFPRASSNVYVATFFV